jgi:hypothetical protein
MNGVGTESIQGRHSLLISSISPSMDEAATKEELRPVKKQLVSNINLGLFNSLILGAETTETIGRRLQHVWFVLQVGEYLVLASLIYLSNNSSQQKHPRPKSMCNTHGEG